MRDICPGLSGGVAARVVLFVCERYRRVPPQMSSHAAMAYLFWRQDDQYAPHYRSLGQQQKPLERGDRATFWNPPPAVDGGADHMSVLVDIAFLAGDERDRHPLGAQFLADLDGQQTQGCQIDALLMGGEGCERLKRLVGLSAVGRTQVGLQVSGAQMRVGKDVTPMIVISHDYPQTQPS